MWEGSEAKFDERAKENTKGVGSQVSSRYRSSICMRPRRQKMISPAILTDEALQSFLNRITPVRRAIQQIILFGSRARGDALPDSDYDLLLVVPAKTDELIDLLYSAVIDTLLASGRLISLKIFTESEYQRLTNLSTPFMRRVEAEGISLG